MCVTARETARDSLCGGDSGGPVFQTTRSGRVVQFGVFSLSEKRPCGGGGVDIVTHKNQRGLGAGRGAIKNTMWFVKLSVYAAHVRSFLKNRESVHWRKYDG